MPDDDRELDDNGFETTTGLGYRDSDQGDAQESRDSLWRYQGGNEPPDEEREEHEKTRDELREEHEKTRDELRETREELGETREELRETREEMQEARESRSDEGEQGERGFEVEP
jgi:hypothetical protein